MLDLVLEAWSRRKWLAIIVFVLPFAAAATIVTMIPSIYQSTATVLVERQQVPEGLVRPTVTGEIETRLRTISQETLSRSRLDSLITRFGLYSDLRKVRPQEALIERMRADIRLDLRGAEQRGRASTTIAFALSYRGRDPETVAQVTNALASFYIEENLKARERQATGTAQFLKAQLGEAKKRLDELETRVSAFRQRHVGELPQQMQANLSTLDNLTAQLRLNNDNQLRAAERRENLRLQLAEVGSMAESTTAATATVPTATVPTAAGPPERSSGSLTQLKQDLLAARVRYTEDHPAVVRLRERIRVLERELAEVKSEAPARPDTTADTPAARPASPYMLRLREAISGAETEFKVLKAEEQQLRAAIAGYRTRVENTPKREQEFQELSRDYDSTKDLYQSLVKRHDEAQLAESMEQRQKGEQFRILDPALASSIPAAPNRPRLLVMALFLSLGLAVGVVVLAESLDTSFHRLDALRAFTVVPVIASIPGIVTAADSRRSRWRFRLAASGTGLALMLIISLSYWFAHGNEDLIRW